MCASIREFRKGVDLRAMNYEYTSAPEPRLGLQISDDICWYCMPLPFALDHVNCWLLGDPGEQTLIDTGVDNAATRKHWQEIFATSDRWPKEVLVTHFHPDHVGLAGWFAKHGCAAFTGSEVEIEVASMLWLSQDDTYAEVYRDWYTAHGLPEPAISTVMRNGNTYRGKVHQFPPSSQWSYLAEGQKTVIAGREYRVMIGRGHSPDMVLLYRADDHVLIAADQVLPAISPNISVMPRLKDQNPLNSFLNTLSQLEALPEDTLVLPSHGLPFRGLRPRLAALREHHKQRLQQVLDACAAARTAYELFPVLFKRKLDAQQLSFALGESLSHLHFLEHQGQLQRVESDGIIRFSS